MKDFYKYAKKMINKKEMPLALKKAYIANGMENRLEGVYRLAAKYFEENADAPQAIMMHYNQILTDFAFYEDLIDAKGSKEKAMEFYSAHVLEIMPEKAEQFRKIIKLSGIYKKMPAIFSFFMKKIYGQASGFKMIDKNRKGVFAVDVTVCPYKETCQKYNHPELAHFFCDSDDICYGNLHQNLIWKRTKTIGRGDDICDFRLYLKGTTLQEEENKK